MPRQNGNGSRKTVSVYFYGEDILAVQELDPNETYVPIGRLCETLGLNRAAQEKRIKSHAVLGSGVKLLRVEVGNGYEQALCLRVDLIPLWLTGLDVSQVMEEHQARLELFQREATSMLWQAFKPQGFTPEDALLPPRHEQSPAEHAYVAAQTIATLARHQMLIERQLNIARAARNPQSGDPWSPGEAVDDTQAALLAQAVRRVATTAAERTRRNEYAGVYSGLYRQFSISSYRRMPASRLHEAMEWLDRWRGDLLGEPEPPPDI
jgi:hypothetical protein